MLFYVCLYVTIGTICLLLVALFNSQFLFNITEILFAIFLWVVIPYLIIYNLIKKIKNKKGSVKNGKN